MKLRKGWLKRQVKAAVKDIKTWPKWMQRVMKGPRPTEEARCYVKYFAN